MKKICKKTCEINLKLPYLSYTEKSPYESHNMWSAPFEGWGQTHLSVNREVYLFPILHLRSKKKQKNITKGAERQMKKKFKRLVATALAGFMLISTVPSGSLLAAEETTESVTAEAETQTDDSEQIPATEDVTVISEEETDTTVVEDTEEVSTEAETVQNTESDQEPTELVTEEASDDTDVTEATEASEATETVSEEKATSEEKEIVSEEKEDAEEPTEEVEENKEDEGGVVDTVISMLEPITGVSVSGIDFSSKELLIGTEDPSVFTADTEVVSEYNGVYLTRYSSVELTKVAYTYYYGKVDFVSANIIFKVADEEYAADMSNVNEGNDALANLNEMGAMSTPDRTIAVIDTGINASDLVGSVSVLGGSTSDNNGHGTAMYKYIKEENPNAKILSIKALGDDGRGKADAIIAAITYAVESKVDIISLSVSAYSSKDNAAVRSAIEDAVARGIKVVGSAGNDSSNAKYFIPGGIESAIIAGACDEMGTKIYKSNYGSTVDYYVVSNSTSEATARLSGLIAKSVDLNNCNKIYKTVTIINEDPDIPTHYDSEFSTTYHDIKVTLGTKEYTIPSEIRCENVTVSNTVLKNEKGYTGEYDGTGYKFTGAQNSTTEGGTYWIIGNTTFPHTTPTDDPNPDYSATQNCGTYHEWDWDGDVYGLGEEELEDRFPRYSVEKGDAFCIEAQKTSHATNGDVTFRLTANGAVSTSYIKNDGNYYYIPYFAVGGHSTTSGLNNDSKWQNYGAVIYLLVPMTSKYYIAIYKKDSEGNAMRGVTFNVQVDGKTVKDGDDDMVLTTNSNGIASYYVGEFTKDPVVKVKENWTNERYKPQSTSWRKVGTYGTQKEANTQAKKAKKNVFINDKYYYYTSIVKTGNTGISTRGFEGAYLGLYDVNKNFSDDHLIAVAHIDKDGYCDNLYGTVDSTVAGHSCKARTTYCTDGWKKTRTYTPSGSTTAHTQYYIEMGKDSLTDTLMNSKKFTWVELQAPAGYIKSDVGMPATITKSLELAEQVTQVQYRDTVDKFVNDNPSYGCIKKSSSKPAYSNNNPNYSFEGAEYKVYKDQTAATTATENNNFAGALATFTIKADGSSNILNMTDLMEKRNGKSINTTFYVVESKSGKNYKRSKEVAELTVKPTENYDESKAAVANVKDEPVNDPFNVEIVKNDALSGSKDLPEGKTLEGAKFRVDFYAVPITETHSYTDLVNNCADKKVASYSKEITITKRADGRYIADLGTTVPVGYITITETQAPKDYSLDGAKVYLLNDKTKDITGNLAFVTSAVFNADKTAYDEFTYHPSYPTINLANKTAAAFNITVDEPPIRGNVQVDKADVATGDPMEGVRFRIDQVKAAKADNIYEADDIIETHYIYTDVQGHATTVAATYDNVNYYDGPKDYDSTNATVWFEKGENDTKMPVTDGYAALPAGTFCITEEKTTANAGYQMAKPWTFVIDKDHTLQTYKTFTDGKVYNVPKPEITTVATAVLRKEGDAEHDDIKMCPASSGREIKDVVHYTHLKADTQYTLVSRIMEIQSDGTVVPFKQGDEEVVVTNTFTTAPAPADAKTDLCATGDYEVLFTNLDFTGLFKRNYVVYQTLYLGTETEGAGVLTNYADANPEDEDFFPVVHEDPNDENQRFHTPKGETEANDVSGTKTVTYTEKVELHDVVKYEGLEPNREYELTGKLYLRPDDAKDHDEYTEEELEAMVLKDKAGNPITATVTHTPTEPNGEVEVVFVFDADLITGEAETIVVFENETDKKTGINVFTHANINDKGQTVYKPSISTTAMDTNGRSELAADSELFRDEIQYTNLEANTEYRVVGVAMNKKTKKVLTLGGVEVTAEDTFTTGESNRENGAVDGTFTLEFEITAEMQKDLPGVDMVIYETFYVKDKKTGEWRVAAQHCDINDIGQELKVPTLKTTLLDKKTMTHVAYPDETCTLVDTCTYTNLIPGRRYVMEGVLHIQDENETILKDKDGKPVTAKKTFTASDTGNGVVELTFKFSAKPLYLEAKSIVAFESCMPEFDKIPVAVHMDIHDKDQTVQYPKVGTKASLVKKKVEGQTATFEVTDQIMLSNLNTKYTYVAKASLVDRKTSKTVELNGQKLETELEFKVKTPNGSVNVTFPEFTCGIYDTIDYVVFEKVYVKVKNEDGDFDLKLIGHHEDLTDTNQQVFYTDTPTGDDTPVALFIGLFALAMAGIGLIVWKKRKLNKK